MLVLSHHCHRSTFALLFKAALLICHSKTGEILSGRTRSKLCTKLGDAHMGSCDPHSLQNFWFWLSRCIFSFGDGSIFLTFYWGDCVGSGVHIPQSTYCPKFELCRREAIRLRLVELVDSLAPVIGSCGVAFLPSHRQSNQNSSGFGKPDSIFWQVMNSNLFYMVHHFQASWSLL